MDGERFKHLFVVNEHIGVAWNIEEGRVQVLVDGQPVLNCASLIENVSPVDDAITSIDDLTKVKSTRDLEKKYARDIQGIEAEVLANASKIQVWADHDYDTRLLNTKISFSLLGALTNVGDQKAKRIWEGDIMDRWNSGKDVARQTILESLSRVAPSTALGSYIMIISETTHAIRDSGMVEKILLPVKKALLSLNTNLPSHVLERFAGDPEVDIRQVVARRVNSSLDILVRLAGDTDVSVRRAVAQNENTPSDTLERLAGDTDVHVRRDVVSNKNTLPEVLKRLAGDADVYVRREVASNKNTLPEVLKRLAGDADVEVRWEVAKNNNTPSDTLKHLAGDTDWLVRQIVVRNSRTPPEVLVRLAGDTSAHVRRAVAQQERITPTTIVRLAGDVCLDVRWEVVKHKNTPPEALALLIGDKKVYPRRRVARERVLAADRALVLDPKNADRWVDLGIAKTVHYGVDVKGIIDAYRKAIELNPVHFEAWFNLGCVFLTSGDVNGAFGAIRKAINLNPRNANAWINLGIVFFTSGDVKGAIDATRKAIIIKPRYAIAYYKMASYYAINVQAGDHIDIDNALYFLKRALHYDYSRIMYMAKDDRDFSAINGDPRFIALLNGKDLW